LDGVPFQRLTEVDKGGLVVLFSLLEIEVVAKESKGNKSSGLGGFNFAYIKAFWYLMKDGGEDNVWSIPWECGVAIDRFMRHGLIQIWGNNKSLNKIGGVVDLIKTLSWSWKWLAKFGVVVPRAARKCFFLKNCSQMALIFCNGCSICISLALLINKVVLYFVLIKYFQKKSCFWEKWTHCSAIYLNGASFIFNILNWTIFYSCAKYYKQKERKKERNV